MTYLPWVFQIVSNHPRSMRRLTATAIGAFFCSGATGEMEIEHYKNNDQNNRMAL
jgi:hypothetical protein